MLDRIADAACRDGRPQDVQVTVENAGTLGIVVGADWSVLNHVPADLHPPYVVSVGNDQSREPVVPAVHDRRRRQPVRVGGLERDPAGARVIISVSAPTASGAISGMALAIGWRAMMLK